MILGKDLFRWACSFSPRRGYWGFLFTTLASRTGLRETLQRNRFVTFGTSLLAQEGNSCLLHKEVNLVTTWRRSYSQLTNPQERTVVSAWASWVRLLNQSKRWWAKLQDWSQQGRPLHQSNPPPWDAGRSQHIRDHTASQELPWPWQRKYVGLKLSFFAAFMQPWRVYIHMFQVLYSVK